VVEILIVYPAGGPPALLLNLVPRKPDPGPNPHLHAFTQLRRQPNLFKSSLSPPPAKALLPDVPPPASGSHFPLCTLLRLMHPSPLTQHRSPPTRTPPQKSPPSLPPLFKTRSLLVPALRGSLSRLTARGRRSRTREGCPGTGAAAAPAAVTTSGGSHPAGSSGRISAPRPPRDVTATRLPRGAFREL
jgi:hypothetical protein